MKQLIISPTQCYYAACLRRALAVTRPRASDRDATIGRLPAWSGGHDISSHWQHPSSTSDAVMRATWHSCWFRLGSHADKPHGNHHASGSDVLGNGITETRTYSNDNLLTAINYSNTSLGDLTYTWDTNENKTSESISGTMSGYGFTQSGTVYDDEDRLTGYARSNSSLTQSWSLTSVGDWSSVTTNGTAQSRTHGPTHELLTAGGQTVNTDVKGNITLLPTALSSLASTALGMSWDFDNKLKSVDVGNDSSTDVEYKYDALGRRVARVGSSGSYVYVQSDQQTIADYGVGDAPSSPPYRYVYASYIDEPVVRKGAGTGGTIHYYHRNQQYSITAVTTSTGAIAERYAYSAYGEPTILDGSGSPLANQASSFGNRYTYTGREWDATVGLHHFRARWMSPKTGRFLARDPIGYRGSPFDLYEMLDSRPIDRTDALGLQGGFHGNTICCGGKTIYVGPGGQSCCNGKVYSPDRECCEDKTIVAKVKIWNCIVDEGLNLARCYDYSPLGWVGCPLGWRGRHSYVCLDGPNLGCFSAYKEGVMTGEWNIFDSSRLCSSLWCSSEHFN